MNPLEKIAALFAELKKTALNSTAVKMLQQKKKELDDFIKSKEDELAFNWNKIEKDFTQDVEIWTGNVCSISDRCRNDIAGGNEDTSTSISADALLSVIGNIDMRFTIAVEILKGAAKAMESEDCNNLSSFNDKWMKNLKKQTVDFYLFKMYVYSKYNLLDPSSKLKDMTDDDLIPIMDSYLEERLFEPEKMSRLYTDAWLASTKDKDIGYWAEKDEDAGYIVIKMVYVCPILTVFNMADLTTNGTWKSKAYIDDVEKPDGTKQRLANEYTEDTKLVNLPYKIVVKIEVQVQSGESKSLPDSRFHKTPKGKWSKDFGHDQLISTWFEKVQNNLTINDLSAE
jgi:hypothetical protein